MKSSFYLRWEILESIWRRWGNQNSISESAISNWIHRWSGLVLRNRAQTHCCRMSNNFGNDMRASTNVPETFTADYPFTSSRERETLSCAVLSSWATMHFEWRQQKWNMPDIVPSGCLLLWIHINTCIRDAMPSSLPSPPHSESLCLPHSTIYDRFVLARTPYTLVFFYDVQMFLVKRPPHIIINNFRAWSINYLAIRCTAANIHLDFYTSIQCSAVQCFE